MSDRVGICEEHEVVQHCRVCNLTAERDSLKVQQEKLLLALESVDFAIGMEKYLHDSFAWKNLRQEIQKVIAKAKAGQP